MTLFSIISISYQNLDGLRETVESVADQTFGDYEHIVVDGGSDDGTADYLTQHFEGDWTSERDDGRYDAMNKGAARASGQYLWFLHAGDVFGDTTVLQRVADAIATAPDGPPEWLYGLARVVDPDKTLVGVIGFVPFTMFNFAILQRPLPHQATAIKADLFQRLGGYDSRFPVSGDQVLLMGCANSSMPLALADFLCDFDSTGLSSGRTFWKTWKDDYATLSRLGRPVTKSVATDRALTFACSSLRHLARTARNRAVSARGTR